MMPDYILPALGIFSASVMIAVALFNIGDQLKRIADKLEGKP